MLEEKALKETQKKSKRNRKNSQRNSANASRHWMAQWLRFQTEQANPVKPKLFVAFQVPDSSTNLPIFGPLGYFRNLSPALQCVTRSAAYPVEHLRMLVDLWRIRAIFTPIAIGIREYRSWYRWNYLVTTSELQNSKQELAKFRRNFQPKCYASIGPQSLIERSKSPLVCLV